MVLRSVDRFVTKAEKLRPNVGAFTERLLDGAMPWRHMRQAHQLERLCKKHGAERVDALCRRSLEFDVVDVPRLERMLKQPFKAESSAEDEDGGAQGKTRRLRCQLQHRPHCAKSANCPTCQKR